MRRRRIGWRRPGPDVRRSRGRWDRRRCRPARERHPGLHQERLLQTGKPWTAARVRRVARGNACRPRSRRQGHPPPPFRRPRRAAHHRPRRSHPAGPGRLAVRSMASRARYMSRISSASMELTNTRDCGSRSAALPGRGVACLYGPGLGSPPNAAGQLRPRRVACRARVRRMRWPAGACRRRCSVSTPDRRA